MNLVMKCGFIMIAIGKSVIKLEGLRQSNLNHCGDRDSNHDFI